MDKKELEEELKIYKQTTGELRDKLTIANEKLVLMCQMTEYKDQHINMLGKLIDIIEELVVD